MSIIKLQTSLINELIRRKFLFQLFYLTRQLGINTYTYALKSAESETTWLISS